MNNTIEILNYPALAQQTLVVFVAIVIALTVVLALADAVSTWRERSNRQRVIARHRVVHLGVCALCGEERVLDGHTAGFVQVDRSVVQRKVCASCAGLHLTTERVA